MWLLLIWAVGITPTVDTVTAALVDSEKVCHDGQAAARTAHLESRCISLNTSAT